MSKKFHSKAVLASVLALALALPTGALAAEDADSSATAETTVGETADSTEENGEAKKEESFYVMISLDRNMLGMQPGDAAIVKATVKAPKEKDTPVVWSTSDPNVATVDQTGRVFAVKTGDCEIYAAVGSIKARTRVSVTATRLPYDGTSTDSVMSGYTTATEVAAAVKASEVTPLAKFNGTWNAAGSKAVVKGFSEEKATEIGELFSASFQSIEVKDNEITFIGLTAAAAEENSEDADADGETADSDASADEKTEAAADTAEAVAYEYKALEVVKNEDGDTVNVYEAVSEEAPFKYLVVSAPVVDKSNKVATAMYMAYGDDLTALATSSEWPSMFVSADAKTAQISALFKDYKKPAKVVAPMEEGEVADSAAAAAVAEGEEYGAEEVTGDDAE